MCSQASMLGLGRSHPHLSVLGSRRCHGTYVERDGFLRFLRRALPAPPFHGAALALPGIAAVYSHGNRLWDLPGIIHHLFHVCNCNRYLKISNGKLRQLMDLQGLIAINTATNLEGNKDDLTETPSHEYSACSTQETSSSLPPYFSYNPNCKWMEEQDLSPDSEKLANGATLQIAAIPRGLLERVHLFYCCSQCGKVFWEGSHFGRVVSQFEEVLLDISGQDFYQLNAGETDF